MLIWHEFDAHHNEMMEQNELIVTYIYTCVHCTNHTHRYHISIIGEQVMTTDVRKRHLIMTIQYLLNVEYDWINDHRSPHWMKRSLSFYFSIFWTVCLIVRIIFFFIFFVLHLHVFFSSSILCWKKEKNYFGSMELIIHIAISIVSNKQVNWWTFIEYEFNIPVTSNACCILYTKTEEPFISTVKM